MWSEVTELPKRWVQLKSILETEEWILDRISGSHHIFTKPGRRCIPVAFHGGTVSPKYASLILRQAGLSEVEGHLCTEEINDSKQSLDTDTEDVVKDEGRGRKNRKSRAEAARETLAQSLEFVRKDKEMEQARQMLAQMDLEKDMHRQKLENERNKIMGSIQGLVATNNYKDVLEMTSSIDIRDCGSSSQLYEFNCNILFYRTMALGEYALLSLEFNSIEQQDMINEALDFATIALQVSPEKRAGVREISSNLQQRVVTRYLDGLEKEFAVYKKKYAGFDDYDDLGIYTSCETFHRERTAMKRELHKLMDRIVRGFDFLVTITDKRNLTLDKALGNTVIVSFQAMPLIGPMQVCLQKMLLSFDNGDYDLVLHLSKTLTAFLKSYADTFELYCMITSDSNVTPAVLGAAALFLKDFVPIYEFCNEKLKWRRCAILLADAGTNRRLTDDDFGYMMIFIDMFLSFFERSGAHLEHLAVSINTRRFILDSFMDPIIMADGMLNRAMFDQTTDTSRRIRPILRKLTRDKRDLSGVLIESSSIITVFRKSKYDPSRVRLLKLSMILLRLVRIFDDQLSMSQWRSDKRLKLRYIDFPQVLQKSLILMRIMFGFFELHTIIILQQLVLMQLAHDEAENFSLILHGKHAIKEYLPAHFDTPDDPRSSGVWALSHTFNSCGPPFLLKYAVGKDRQKLLIINSIAKDPQDLSKKEASIEALAFETTKMVTKFGARYDKSITSTLLERIIYEEKNKDWCDSFASDDEIQRWTKQKGQKYSKLIGSLFGVFASSEIQLCMTNWKESVEFLLEKLQISISKFRDVPLDILGKIKKNKDAIKLLDTKKILPKWCRKDVDETRKHIIQLLEVAEHITSVLHTATGQMYPIAKSLFNEKWGINEAIRMQQGNFGNKETLAVMKDIRYVNAILLEYSRL